MSTLKVDTILKRTGTGTITVGQSGDTISIPTGATLTVAGSTITAGGTNTPAFFANTNSDQTSLGAGTTTKIQYGTELFDTDGKYDTSNYRFTPGTIGKYYIGASGGGAVNDGDRVALIIYKNGSAYLREQVGNSNPNGDFFSVHGIAEVTADTDYFEAYWFNGSSQAKNFSGGTKTARFWGYKLLT